ncbi:hypothetical protein [Extensimonas perlucida]|uniref:hypothetical protein n=1 Tax=Extensimonas perlucida TaxID=2590786 RepID=UPI00119F7F04|nr:hypothetical protein [Extensimonas perlucida]
MLYSSLQAALQRGGLFAGLRGLGCGGVSFTTQGVGLDLHGLHLFLCGSKRGLQLVRPPTH